ncbi:MAG: hypothetical protein BWY11_00136 [Firmicutes bacterium ADurb.Bin182]|nr:MAG: hypothetical protein BWY11_00136 [Firmicutes bacterium ADurb.Bin182]
MQQIPLYRKKFDRFKGADFSTDPIRVDETRSPRCRNLISDLSGFPEKRPGWRTLHSVDAPVNGLFFCVFKSGAGVFLAHGGTRLYAWADDADPAEICSGMNNAKSAAFAHGGKLYILDGAHYLVVKETESGLSVSRVADGECFVPTTVIGAPAAGGGTPFEGINFLTGRRINSMIGDGMSTDFILDTKPVAQVHSVKVDGVPKAEGTDYTADLENGKIVFGEAPPESAAGGGVDNVTVEFTALLPDGYTDRIEKCTVVAFYGLGNDNRVFLAGNPDTPNTDYQSGLDDPTFFPDTGITKMGSDTSAIMGYLKHHDTMAVVKEDNRQDSEIFIRTAEMTDDKKVIFPVRQGVKGIGAVSRHAFANLRDDPLFLAREGVFALVSEVITQQKSTQERSFFVNSRLANEPGLNEAAAAVWRSYYVLCVNGSCYVADGRQKTGNSTTEQFGYEWYYWTNIPARVFLEHDGELYFGTADGRICKFNTDIPGVSRFNDDGAPIKAFWGTKADDFGAFTRRKTLTKRGCGLLVKPYTRSSVHVYVLTEDGIEKMIRSKTMDLFGFADDIGAELNTDQPVQVVPFNTKVKKFVLLMLVFENDTVNEGFGVFGAELQYALGKYVK